MRLKIEFALILLASIAMLVAMVWNVALAVFAG